VPPRTTSRFSGRPSRATNATSPTPVRSRDNSTFPLNSLNLRRSTPFASASGAPQDKTARSASTMMGILTATSSSGIAASTSRLPAESAPSQRYPAELRLWAEHPAAPTSSPRVPGDTALSQHEPLRETDRITGLFKTVLAGPSFMGIGLETACLHGRHCRRRTVDGWTPVVMARRDLQ
jgi:hypothetical protein